MFHTQSAMKLTATAPSRLLPLAVAHSPVNEIHVRIPTAGFTIMKIDVRA